MVDSGSYRWLGLFSRNRVRKEPSQTVGQPSLLDAATSEFRHSDEGRSIIYENEPVADNSGSGTASSQADAVRTAIRNGDVQSATSLSEALRAEHPDIPDGYRLGAAVLHEAGCKREAFDLLKQAEAKFPAETWPLLDQIAFFQRDGNWYEIGECAARLRLLSPQASAGYQFGLMSLVRRNRVTEIGQLIERAMEALPEEEWLLEAAVTHEVQSGQFQRAVRSAETLRLLYPDNVLGYREGGVALRRIGSFEDARDVLQAAAERFASNDWVIVESAWLALRCGNLDDAVNIANAVRDADPTSYAGHMIAVEALRMAGRLEEAERVLAEAVYNLNSSAWLASEGALIAEARGDQENASRIWQSVRTDFPKDLAGYLGGVRMARVASRLDEAERIFNDGYQIFDRSAALLVEGAHVAALGGHFDQASTRWSALRALDPNNQDAYRLGIDASQKAGDEELASSTLLEAAHRFPDAVWIAEYRARLAPTDKVELMALQASLSQLVNMNITIVSGWQDCVDRTYALLSSKDPFFLGRVGGSDTNAVAAYLTNEALGRESTHPDVICHLKIVERYNGYYDRDNDPANFLRYIKSIADCYAEARHAFFCNYQLLSLYFPNNLDKSFYREQFENKIGFQLLANKLLGSRNGLEAFPYTFVEKLASHPQTLMNVFARALPGKRVLVISPFAKSIQANFHNRRSFFKDFDYPEFGLQVYNTPITYAGLPSEFYPDRNWFETTNKMIDEISMLQFDVALLSCGSYAMPLGQHIFEKMGRQAIYIGGVLQLMFGIMGRRYNNVFITNQINLKSFIVPVESKQYLSHVSVSQETAHEAFGAYF